MGRRTVSTNVQLDPNAYFLFYLKDSLAGILENFSKIRDDLEPFGVFSRIEKVVHAQRLKAWVLRMQFDSN
jgi:hypothetical protein